MKTIKNIGIVFAVFFLFGLGTMRMWTHPAFLLLLVGAISYLYHLINRKPITRRIVS